MRVLRNTVVREWADRQEEVPTETSGLPVIGQMDLGTGPVPMHRFSSLVPMRERTTGDLEEMALLAGQGVGLVHTVEPVATVIAELTGQAVTTLGRYRTA
jgi:NAD(P)H-dependent flavin oxidoreductase YrpB (nitropropane dioxygenase family)